jgi:uncharacterized membrane protein
LEFRNLRITEEPHNTYVNVLHSYGWGGGAAFIVMTILTLTIGIKVLKTSSPNRLLMIPLIATYAPLVIEAGIIDVDHWRHYFLIVGLIWGVATGYQNVSKAQSNTGAALI